MINRKESLFINGIEAFNQNRFYDAHEYWEDLWSEYYFQDRLYIQGLIQMAVGYFHITNNNIKGAKGLFKKCLPKLKQFETNETRGLNLKEIIESVENSLKCVNKINQINEFDWTLPIKIKRNNAS